MAKVQKLSDIQQEIAFTEFDFYLRYEENFKSGDSRESIPNRIVSVSKENKIDTSFTQKGRSGKNEIKNATMQPDVLRVERDFMEVVYPNVTENEKIGLETRADDIKCDEFDRKNMAKSAG